MKQITYDSGKHLHLGYYEDGHDFEAIAYKRELENTWDIFFDQKEHGIENLEINEPYIEHQGARIFSVKTTDLSYDEGSEQFKKWLHERNLI